MIKKDLLKAVNRAKRALWTGGWLLILSLALCILKIYDAAYIVGVVAGLFLGIGCLPVELRKDYQKVKEA